MVVDLAERRLHGMRAVYVNRVDADSTGGKRCGARCDAVGDVAKEDRATVAADNEGYDVKFSAISDADTEADNDVVDCSDAVYCDVSGEDAGAI